MSVVEISRGDSPLILGLPHTGTGVPEEIAQGLNDNGKAVADTDWHIHRLYDGLAPGVTTVRTTMHRYVIDVNRDPGGVSLYPGQNTTSLCPLTDFNIGTNGGTTCAASIQDRVAAICGAAGGYRSVLNGRFKGGWTTRHYGRPQDGVHAIQMELAQSAYMLERPPWTYQPDRAARIRGHLKTILEYLIHWRPE